MLPALMAAGTALEVYGTLKSGSAARRAADNRATALKAQATRRLQQGKQQSEMILSQGGMSQTSELSSQLGRGISREDVASGGSLLEIAERARFSSDQALEQARLDSESLMNDSYATSQEGRDAQQASLFSAGGSILKQGGKYLEGRYGQDAYKTFF
jgi:hypothetical protein